jgi:uncharacterized protein DUF2779
MYRLSKSKLLSALQCPKRLYLEIHQPDLAEVDAALQARFDIGHAVGATARSLYPGGRLIEHQDDLATALRETEAALVGSDDVVLFEPALQHGGILIRVDILIRRNGRLRFLEVKSSTQVYDHHLQDAAIQAWVIEGAGYPVDRASILHIDNSFVYGGNGDYRHLFAEIDVTQDIEAFKAQVPELVSRSQTLLAGPLPDIAVGKQCNDPFACQFLAYCDRDAAEFPLSIFSSNWRLRDRLLAQGHRDVRDVSLEQLDSRKLQRIWRSTMSGQPELDPVAAKVIEELGLPRYYLDFETIRFAVPIWAGTSPYQQLPFQWSCHLQTEDAELEHREFLDVSGDAPMRPFAESLIAAMGSEGAILVYSGFEGRILRELGVRYPDLAIPLAAMGARLFDLLSVAREHYYHPAMKGSWSIKSVLPTIAPELDYADLGEVSDGGAAQSAYLELLAPDTALPRRAHLIEALRVYCQRDTMAMVRLAKFFVDGVTS